MALESADFCNKYLRSEPQDVGLVTLASKLTYIHTYPIREVLHGCRLKFVCAEGDSEVSRVAYGVDKVFCVAIFPFNLLSLMCLNEPITYKTYLIIRNYLH